MSPQIMFFFHLVLRLAFPCFSKSSYLRSYDVQSHPVCLPVQFWVQCQNNLGICIKARKPFYYLDSLAVFAVTVLIRANCFCIPQYISVQSLALCIIVGHWFLIKHFHMQWYIHQIAGSISVTMQKFRLSFLSNFQAKSTVEPFSYLIQNELSSHFTHLVWVHIHTLLRVTSNTSNH